MRKLHSVTVISALFISACLLSQHVTKNGKTDTEMEMAGKDMKAELINHLLGTAYYDLMAIKEHPSPKD